jgi:hypothetical protein
MYFTETFTKFLIDAEIKIADFACEAASGFTDVVFLSFDQRTLPLKTIVGDELRTTLGCRQRVIKRF